jgi:hypothetical protein
MNFDIFFDSFFSQRWAALNEALAARSRRRKMAALDCQYHTSSLAGEPSTLLGSRDGVDHPHYRELTLGPSNHAVA